MNSIRLSLVIAVLASGCSRKSPLAEPEFSDAARYTLQNFEGTDVDLAYTLRAFEESVYLTMDAESENVIDRALIVEALTESDVADLEHPDLDVSAALPVAVAGISKYTPAEHQLIHLLVDHTPVEPYSPDHYVRSFHEDTELCWQDQGCTRLLTTNELTKKNALMEIPFTLQKHYRWIDLNLPPPSEFEDGDELPTQTEDPRWGFIARSWTTDIYEGEGGNTAIEISFSAEVWLPREGRGFVRTSEDTNFEDGEWTTDSTGGGTLHLLAVWAQTRLGFAASDDVVIGTTRSGIDNNMVAAEEWLIEEFGER